MSKMFTWASFVIRWLAISALVFATYNPSGYSYLHWLGTWQTDLVALKIATGLIIVGLFWLIAFAAWLTLRLVGLLLLLATLVSLAAAAWQLGFISPTSTALQFLLLGVIATHLTIGVSYAHIRYRLTGQLQSRILEELQG